VLGEEERAPDDAELERMRALVRDAMREGAFGLSTGLFYTPAYYATTEEVIALARAAAEWPDAIYDTHDRDLGATYRGIGYDASVAEAIRIGEESGLRVIFSHFNPQGATNYGRAAVGARMIDDARARGVEVWAAQHPYTATQSNLRAYALPRWAAAGGPDAVRRRFADADTLALLRTQIVESLDLRGGAGKILFADADPRLNGRTLAEVAAAWEVDVPEAVRRILVESGNATVMNLDLYDIENTRYLATMPWMMTCTDGRTPAEGQRIVHPRVYGAFARKLRQFALDERLVSTPFAVRSMSGLAADFLRLPDRGYVREGMRADLAVLDLDRYRDRATFEDPHHYAEGAVHVLVNGAFAVRDEAFTGALAGRALRADSGRLQLGFIGRAAALRQAPRHDPGAPAHAERHEQAREAAARALESHGRSAPHELTDDEGTAPAPGDVQRQEPRPVHDARQRRGQTGEHARRDGEAPAGHREPGKVRPEHRPGIPGGHERRHALGIDQVQDAEDRE
jgi:N-acyl-D-amino-acid deacylase